MTRLSTLLVFILLLFSGCSDRHSGSSQQAGRAFGNQDLVIRENEHDETIEVYRGGQEDPVLTQNAREGFRPYIHPIVAPDAKGVLTEMSPEHHSHQTGLYWGFTSVNGRDFFHNPGENYWQRVSAGIMEAESSGGSAGIHNHDHNHSHDQEPEQGQANPDSEHEGESESKAVAWQTVYNLLDEEGEAILTETQNWSMYTDDGAYYLDLEWRGEAKTQIIIGEYDYGGLFLRMPWREGISGEVINSVRQRDGRAEGQKAQWIDLGMQIGGRDDFAHIAILDHSDNRGFPNAWRVDDQMGVGPALTRTGDWTLEEGETGVIRYRIKIYTGEFNNVELENAWEEYVETPMDYSTIPMWRIAQQEGRQAEFLTPDEAAGNMTLSEGFKVTAWAGEPDITTPMAFTWDDKGRLWVAENNDYESRGSGFSSAGDSRILILEDTDRDGYADSRKVFMEGIAFPAAMAVGFDGLFLGAPPNLLFVPDRNGDDRADRDDIEVLLTGWGIDDRHETINSLHWGPDGWLYGLQGLFTSSTVGKPKAGAESVYTHNDPFPESLDDLVEGEGIDMNGGVWRYHPTKDRFEVVAHGLSNPWGIDHDAKGQLFVTACVIPHLWHIVPGGVYHRQGGSHFNPYVYNDIQTITDHRHRSAHGGANFYLSDAFPEQHFGRIFMANIHEHAVLSDIVERDGSGFTARHGEDFMLANNAAWVGFSTEIGPDGGLYILDWHDKDICGTEVLNGDTGRIFKIMPEESRAAQWEGRYVDVSTLTDEELVDLQTRNSAWHARRARVNLQYRASQGELEEETFQRLREMFRTHSNPDWRLRAMWALHAMEGFSESELVEALGDEDEYVRSWAIQMLAEDYSLTSPIGTNATRYFNWGIRNPSDVQPPSEQVLEHFHRMAREDSSPVVRLYLASTLHRLAPSLRWEIAGQLMQNGEDADDHNIPNMVWFGFEPLVEIHPDRALEIAGRSEIPMIARFASRRAVQAGALESLITAIGNGPPRQMSLLEGMREGLEGRSADLGVPSNWRRVHETLQQSGGRAAELALEVAQQLGDTGASLEFLTLLQDRGTSVEKRREALRALAGRQHPDLMDELPVLLDEPGLRTDVIRAVSEFNEEELGRMLMVRYEEFTTDEKLEVVRTMASRPVYGRMLTQALEDGEIPKRDIPVDVARQLQRVVGVGFVDVWGPIGEESSTGQEEYAEYRELLIDEAVQNADVRQGRLVYRRTCGPCHVMYGEGGEIGPELTGSNRANLDYLLSNVMNPSEEIQDAYKLVVVTTREGRTYSGNIVSESERQITLRTVGQGETVINKSDIQTREETSQSMMPPRLFDALTDREVLDLVAYLRTTEQVSLPEE